MQTANPEDTRTAAVSKHQEVLKLADARRTPLGERLACLRLQIVDAGEKLLSWQEIEQNIADGRERRELDAG